MIIHKYGTVTITPEGPVRIEGWNIEREPADPADATEEQLLLAFAINWAKKKFDAAASQATMEVLRKWSRDQAMKIAIKK